MLKNIRTMAARHIKDNINKYSLLLITFVTGICTGAFTVNGLNSFQKTELQNFISGFLQLSAKQNVDSMELLRLAGLENLKIVIVIWILGVSIIGIPLIYLVIGIKGFITGFSSGLLINTMALRGVLLSSIAILPQEIIIVPCMLALSVNGINFSLKIIKNRSKFNIIKNNLKTNLFSYCALTLFFCILLFIGVLVEAYLTPVLIRIMNPVFG